MITFVDIGARGGIKQKWRLIRDQLKVVCFEPNPEEQENLRKQVWWEDAVIIPSGLWCVKGTINLYITENPGLTSVYKLSPKMVGRLSANDFKVVKTIRMPVNTLDSYDLKPDFIKLDTQGSELEILKGAEESLKTTTCIECEVEFEEVYDGQGLFCDIHAFLLARGFTLWGITTRYLSGTRATLFGDGVWFRDGTEGERKREIIEGVYLDKGI